MQPGSTAPGKLTEKNHGTDPEAGPPQPGFALPAGGKSKVIHLHEVALTENNKTEKPRRGVALQSAGTSAPGSKEALIKKIFEAIVYYTNQSNFEKAQALHTRLVKEAPNAIHLIVKSAEFIENRKKSAMDPEKIRPWADLFNQFTSAEAAAFYFALKDFVVRPNQPVFQQGNCDTRLYFIHSGRLKIKYFDYNIRKNVAIGVLGPGDIAGIETFFTLTNHTTNLIAADISKLSYLEKADYQGIVREHHNIESRLFQYCENKQLEIQNRQERPETGNRRAYQRYKAELMAELRRLDENGQPIEGRMNGKMTDISAGGLGLFVKNLKIGDAACLHNSRIMVSASYTQYGLTHELIKTGSVVSLKFHPLGECTVHVQFEEPIDDERVIAIAQQADVIAYI